VTARLDSAELLWLAGLALFAALLGLLAGLEPKLAIATAIGSGFVLLVFMDLGLGLALFTMLSFLEVLPDQGAVVSIGKVGGALLALAWLAVVVTRPDAKSDFFAVHPEMAAVICAFLGWTLLSASWAGNPAEALGAFGRYVLNAVLFLIVFTAVRTKRQALFVVAAFVTGAVLAALYGLYFGGGPDAYTGRLAGGGNDPNGLAAVLVVGLALSAGLAGNLRRSPGLRVATAAAAAICLIGLFFTVSRAGLIALGVSLIAALLLAGRWRPRIFVGAAVVAFVTVYYFATLAPPEARDRITQSTSGQARLQEGRTTIWAVGERMARANFVKGVGAGNFRDASPHYLLAPGAVERSDQIIDKPLVAHNIYLELLAETGIVGLTLFCAILVFCLSCAVRAAHEFARRNDPGGEILARSLAIGLVGLLAAAFFNSMEFNKELWLLLGLCPALLAAARAQTAPVDT
jgi:putative inorganic carbon (hco3(-)) transporter